MRKAHLILCLAGAALMPGCDYDEAPGHKDDADKAAIVNAIHAEETQALADWNAKDAPKVTSHYREDAMLMLPRMAPLTGAAQIGPAVDGALKDPNFALTFQSHKVGVADSGDLAYSRGVFTQSSTDPVTKKKVTESGSYVTVFKKQADGSWKAIEDIVTVGAPVTPAPAPAT
jgi:ketosteroid isomerase-like protein